MSDFFDSEFVQDAITDINELQEEIYTEVFTFDKLDHEEKLKHLDKLHKLISSTLIDEMSFSYPSLRNLDYLLLFLL